VLISPVAVPIVFAAKWLPAVPLFQWALMETIAQTVSGLIGQTQAAAGRRRDQLMTFVACNLIRVGLVYAGTRLFGFYALGPAGYIATLIEMGTLAFLLSRTVPGCMGMVKAAFLPVVTLHLFTGLAVLAGMLVAPTQPWLAMGVGLAMLAVLFAAYDRLVPSHPVATPVQWLLQIVRNRGGHG
jgi:O-antigen/teichoic acid export membrane protein